MNHFFSPWKHRRFIAAILLLAGIFAVSACATPRFLEPRATLTPSLTPTASPSSTPTLRPTQTMTPTVAPTLAPMTLLKGPSVIFTGKNTEMKLFWQAGEARAFVVEVGEDLSYSLASVKVGPADARNFYYYVTISKLKPGTRYYYRLVDNQKQAAGTFFTAPPSSATRLKFIAYGDTQTYPERHESIARQVTRLLQADPQYQTLSLLLGDLTTDGDRSEDWSNEFFNPQYTNVRALLANVAVVPTRGNHENGAVLFGRYFPMPYVDGKYWSFDYGPAHFTIIDAYTDVRPGSKQHRWLEKDLAKTKQPWKFVTMHVPGWAASADIPGNAFVQNELQPLMEKYGVAAFFAGHVHNYSRAEINGVTHLTIGTGGGTTFAVDEQPYIIASFGDIGFGKFEIDGDQMTGWFIDRDGIWQDRFTIERPGMK